MTCSINCYYYITNAHLNSVFDECKSKIGNVGPSVRILTEYRDFLFEKIAERSSTKKYIFRLMIEFIREHIYSVKNDDTLLFDPLDIVDNTSVDVVKMFTRKMLFYYDGTSENEFKNISMSYKELLKVVKDLTDEFSDWEQKCKGISPTGTNYWDGKRIGVLELYHKIMKLFSKDSDKMPGCENNSCGIDEDPKIKEDILKRLKRLELLGQFSFENLREFDAVIKKIEEI